MADGLLARDTHYSKDNCDFSVVQDSARYTATLSGTVTMDNTYPNLCRFNPNGSNRNILLPPEADSVNVTRRIVNTGTAGNLVVKDDSGTYTYVTLTPGTWGDVHCDGSSWVSVTGPIDANSEFGDDIFRVVGSSDATKKLAFEVDGLTTGTTRTATVPDANMDLDVAAKWTRAASGTPAKLDLREDADNGTSKVTIQAPSSLGADRTVSLPSGGNLDLEATRAWQANHTPAGAGTNESQAFYEETGSGTNKCTVQAAPMAADRTLTLPTGGDLTLETVRTKCALITEASAGVPTSMAFYEETGSGTNKATVKAPVLAADIDVTLPATALDMADLPDVVACWTPAGAGNGTQLDLYEPTGGGTSRIRLEAPALSGNRAVTFPDADLNLATHASKLALITEAIAGTGTTMDFFEPTGGGASKASVVAPALGGDITVTLPTASLDMADLPDLVTAWTPAAAGTGSSLDLYEPTGGGASYFRITAPALGGNVSMTLPNHNVTWGTFLESELKVTNDAAPTKVLDFDCQYITAGQTRSIIMADQDIDLGAHERDLDNLLEHVAIANSAELTNSNAETSLGNHQIAANTLGEGTRIKVSWLGYVSADNAGTTLTVRLRLGGLAGSVIYQSAAVDTSVGHIFSGEAELVVRGAPGAAVAIQGRTHAADPAAAGAAAVLASRFAPTNFATNGALDVDVTGQWNAADANSVRLEAFNVELIGALL